MIDLLLIAAGLAGLVSVRWLVNSATLFAEALGVSELIVASPSWPRGRPCPEVATSVMASIKGERDIAIGNVVGSNLFNLMAVLGLASAISPVGITVPPAALRVDIIVMVAVAVAVCPSSSPGTVFRAGKGSCSWAATWRTRPT
ncbi:MAG: hypothetical protein R2856_38230 [Caldilineaceae bacterium]